MPDPFAPDAAEPLSGVYPFNDPGQPVVLHDGPLGGLAAIDVAGVVELSCAPRPGLEWRVGPDAPPQFANRPTVTLLLRRPGGDAEVPGWVRGTDGGWSNGIAIGRADVPVQRIVAHWFNLPDWHGPERLTSPTNDSGQRWWSGRWVTQTGGWRITIDVRPDHQRVWTDLHKADVYVMTHVMELRRADGTAFTPDEAEPLLAALHIGVSFALGRWAAPMLPVGDADGRIVWEDWRPLHCDPARFPSPGWCYEKDHQALGDFLSRLVPAFADPDRRAVLWFQMMFAIISVSDQGFVEQRVMTGAAGLEHIMWQTLVADGILTEHQYRSMAAHQLLRKVLVAAKIPVDIDPGLLPALTRFAADERQRQGIVLDGAHVVTQIRNRLVHPTGDQERVYGRDGLVAEAWLLIRHYLVLLILHSLRYQGLYRDLRKTGGWAADREDVPWAGR